MKTEQYSGFRKAKESQKFWLAHQRKPEHSKASFFSMLSFII